MRHWICHWKNRYWKDAINPEGEPLRSSGSGVFSKRGVSPDDALFVVSILDGTLLLGGRMIVGEIVSRAELVRRRNHDGFYPADEWIVAKADSGSRLDLHRALDPEVTRRLLFTSRKSQPKALFFASDTKLDGQTTRGIRELTPESARLLDRIITITDHAPLSNSMRLVTEELLENPGNTTEFD
jgi:hypothetical protein